MATLEKTATETELAQRVYTRGTEMKLRALARVGIIEEVASIGGVLPGGVNPKVVLSNGSGRLRIRLEGASMGLDKPLLLVGIEHNAYKHADFSAARYVAPDGAMWMAADSSQGQPWFREDLPTDRVVGMLECMDMLEAESHSVSVNLLAFNKKELTPFAIDYGSHPEQ